jgi:hypothetical protein
MGFLTPTFEGVLAEEKVPADLLDRAARLVQSGAFPVDISRSPRSMHPAIAGETRRRYEVIAPEEEPSAGYRAGAETRRLRFVAKDWSTRLAAGLDDVELALEPGGRLSYRVSYRVWARFPVWLAIGLSALTVVAALFILLFGSGTLVAPGTLARAKSSLFWGVVWPWILAAVLIRVQRNAARRVLERFLRDVIAADN